MVAEQLIKCGITVDQIIVKRLLNFKRVRLEMEYGKLRFVRKVVNKLFFRRGKKNISKNITIGKKFSDGGYKCNSLRKLSRLYDIPIAFCDDFHSKSVKSAICSLKPDLIIFTGGGIIRQSILDLPVKGVVNCHMGILPEYRGMDCYVWAILNNEPHKIGLTTHYMDSGIDTGPIINKLQIEANKIKSLTHLEAELEANMPDFMVQTIIDLLFNNRVASSQDTTKGKQYFVPSDVLKKYAEKLAKQRRMG